MSEYTNIRVYLRDDKHADIQAWLQREVEKRHTTASEFVRDLLQEKMVTDEQGPARRQPTQIAIDPEMIHQAITDAMIDDVLPLLRQTIDAAFANAQIAPGQLLADQEDHRDDEDPMDLFDNIMLE